MPDNDVLVIGSGPAGVHAARSLVDAGKRVTMIDGGRAPSSRIEDAETGDFETVRRTDPAQWKMFLGEDLSAISLAGLTGGLGGGQISGNRAYVADVRPGELPLRTLGGFVVQSLARGGLGAGWGAACALLEDTELEAMGLPAADVRRHYETVGRRIGVSGPQTETWIQPPLPPDQNAASVRRYAARNARALAERGIVSAQPHSAILTRDLGGRKASPLGDMEYWADPGRSVWRPQYMLEELLTSPSFTYEGGWIARKIERTADGLRVHCDALSGGASRVFSGRQVAAACGAVNTGRLLLESLGMRGTAVPFLSKPRTLFACLNPHALGKAGPRERISLCQHLLIDTTAYRGMPRACAQLYSYRSLLLFRLAQSIPLPMPQALRVASLLCSSLVIADVRMPAFREEAASLRLRDDGVEIAFAPLSAEDAARRAAAGKAVARALRTVHLLPCKTVSMPEGATVHYAGTVHAGEGSPLTCDADGRSRQLPGVWIADASSFRALPCKPHTFALMANACRVAEAMLRSA